MKLDFTTGEFYEGMAWELHAPYSGSATADEKRVLDREYGWRSIGEFETPALPCPHAKWTGEAVEKTRHDGSVYGYERPWEVPMAALCFNECGHNATALCIQCLDEARERFVGPVVRNQSFR